MPGIPPYHALAAMVLTVAMFVAFARGRVATEIVSLATIVLIALGLFFFPMDGQHQTDGLALAFSGFGHPALITICALMVMGRGLVVTGALEPATRVLARVWQFNTSLGMLVSLLLAMALSTMVNDTPVLVLLLPVFVGLAEKGAMAASKTLIPINAAVLIGGMATTIGTSTNLLVVSIAADLGMEPMHVFDFTPIVAFAALVALPYLWLVMPRLLPDNGQSFTRDRRLFAATMRVDDDSELIGVTPRDLQSRLPEGFAFEDSLDQPITANSRVAVRGTHKALEEAMRSLKARIAPAWVIERLSAAARNKGSDVVVVEMAVTAESRLVGLTIPASGVAGQFGVAVLGIHQHHRGDDRGRHEYAELELKAGDVLLVMGPLAEIELFAQSDNLLLLEGVVELPRRSKAVMAAAIMFGSVGTASVGLWPIAISAMAGAIAMFVTGCVRFERVGNALSANVIVLVAASIAVGRLILETGAAEWLGLLLSSGLQYLPPAMIVAAVMLFVTLLTNFASNAAAATVGTPIAFKIAQTLGLPVEPLVLAVLFGCNLCYATPIAYQTNMLIMEEGQYRFADYLRTGLPLVVLMATTLSIALIYVYM
ncbi:SLC13 family permease [Croceicoccus sp. BE223]|uniref:SLC13 family permease n=1 Tax=Croceicoccus sp. BE223 TaxID=2817716 RepID=UPI002863E44A|nr:SLC13 family permease [Croceicoccus sp. BE223]MDR7103106.1 di/tricarboxylate transporter [Croceicoccus sp. BE223]